MPGGRTYGWVFEPRAPGLVVDSQFLVLRGLTPSLREQADIWWWSSSVLGCCCWYLFMSSGLPEDELDISAFLRGLGIGCAGVCSELSGLDERRLFAVSSWWRLAAAGRSWAPW